MKTKVLLAALISMLLFSTASFAQIDFGIIRYQPEVDFGFSAGAGNYAMRSGRLSLVLATEGSVRFSEGSESLTIGKGECAVVPSSLEYSMNVQGRVYIAECGTLS